MSSSPGSSSSVIDNGTTNRDSGRHYPPALHCTDYVYLNGVLLTLVEIKYQGSVTDPFEKHAATMLLFLVSILVYAMTLTKIKCTVRRLSANDISNVHALSILTIICHVSGALSCELLLSILIPPIWWFTINTFLALLGVALFLCHHHASLLHNLVAKCFGQTLETHSGDGQEGPDLEMAVVEAASKE